MWQYDSPELTIHHCHKIEDLHRHSEESEGHITPENKIIPLKEFGAVAALSLHCENAADNQKWKINVKYIFLLFLGMEEAWKIWFYPHHFNALFLKCSVMQLASSSLVNGSSLRMSS